MGGEVLDGACEEFGEGLLVNANLAPNLARFSLGSYLCNTD